MSDEVNKLDEEIRSLKKRIMTVSMIYFQHEPSMHKIMDYGEGYEDALKRCYDILTFDAKDTPQ